MSNFTDLVRELHIRTDESIEKEFDTEFAFTGFDGIRFYAAKWLVEDILEDDIDKGSQEFFEELFAMYDAVMQEDDYFGGEFPFIETGEII